MVACSPTAQKPGPIECGKYFLLDNKNLCMYIYIYILYTYYRIYLYTYYMVWLWHCNSSWWTRMKWTQKHRLDSNRTFSWASKSWGWGLSTGHLELWDTVDGSEIRRSPVEVGSWNPIVYMVSYILGGAGFLFWGVCFSWLFHLCCELPELQEYFKVETLESEF